MKRFGIGLSFFLLYAAFGYWMFFYLASAHQDAPAAIQFVAITLVFGLGLGFAAQLAFDWRFRRPLRHVVKNAYVAVAIFSVLLLALGLEGLICIAVIAPIAALLIPAGATLLRWLMSLFVTPPKLVLSVLALPFAMNFSGLLPPSTAQTYTVQTSVVIAADSAQLHQLVQTVPDIAPSELPWTLTHSLLNAPQPRSAVTQNGIRTALWTKGVTFQEVLRPETDLKSLTWDFHFPDLSAMRALDYHISPAGPDVIMQSGGYRFDSLDSGATRVTLSTTYQLNTPINPYLAAWGQLFLDDFHMAVLHVIKTRAESSERPIK